MAIYLSKDERRWFFIWSNPEGGRAFAGRCIGTGRTVDEAKRDAVDELHRDLTEIEALTEEDADAD